MADAYRPPILATVFRVSGWLSLVGACVLLLAAVRETSNERTVLSQSEVTDALLTHAFWSAFVPTGSALLISLALLGAAQALEHFSQIAFYARRSLELLERTESLAGPHWSGLPKAVESIRANIVQMRAIRTSPPPAASETSATEVAPSALPGMKFLYVDPDSKVVGPVDVHHLRFLAKTGAINRDTMICVEGEDDWKPMVENLTF